MGINIAEELFIANVMAGFNKNKYLLWDNVISSMQYHLGVGHFMERFLGKFFSYERGKTITNKILTKLTYGEELVDNVNKAVVIFDDEKNRALIEPVLEAIEQSDRFVACNVAGNQTSLDEIVNKRNFKKTEVLEQSSSFIKNALMLHRKTNKQRAEFQKRGINISRQDFFIFGDSFLTTKESLENVLETRDSFIRQNGFDPDIYLFIGEKSELEKIPFFNDRPYLHLKEFSGRNSNVAILDFNSIPEKGIEEIGMGYERRKLLKLLLPHNWLGASQMVYYAARISGPVARIFGKMGKEKIEKLFNERGSTKDKKITSALMTVDANLAIDPDTKNDIRKARKYAAMQRLKTTKVDLMMLYDECQKVRCRYVRMIGRKIKRTRLEDLDSEIKNANSSGFKSFYSHPHAKINPIKALYYDLLQSYNRRVSDIVHRIGYCVTNTMRTLVDDVYDLKVGTFRRKSKVKSETTSYDDEQIEYLINEGVFYKTLIQDIEKNQNDKEKPLFNQWQVREIVKNMKHIVMQENHEYEIDITDRRKLANIADDMIAKYKGKMVGKLIDSD